MTTTQTELGVTNMLKSPPGQRQLTSPFTLFTEVEASVWLRGHSVTLILITANSRDFSPQLPILVLLDLEAILCPSVLHDHCALRGV